MGATKWTIIRETRGASCALVEEVREKIRAGVLIPIWGPEPPWALGAVKAFATTDGAATEILRAVNAHDALVTALQELWAEVHADHGDINLPKWVRMEACEESACVRARAALALAEERECS